MIRVQEELLLIKKNTSEQQFKLKIDARVNTLQKSLKWFKEEAMSLSGVVEVKNEQIKQTQAESLLIQNDITILTQTLKNSKKENRTI